MKKGRIVAIIVLLAFSTSAFALFGSGSKLSWKEKRYLKKNNVTYQVTALNVKSENEDEALKGGYMSQDEVKKYLEDKIQPALDKKNEKADQTRIVDAVIDIEYKRAFSWGKLSSLAALFYDGSITLTENGESRGIYNIKGKVADNSIFGNFKTTFGAKNKNKAKSYFDTVATSIVDSFPSK